MGYKFYLGTALLIGVLFGCVFIGHGMEKNLRPVMDHLQQAADRANDGSMDAATEAAKKANDAWEKRRGLFASFSNHTPMDRIEELLEEVQSLGSTESREAFLAGCAKLKTLLSSLAQDHRFTWWNFF